MREDAAPDILKGITLLYVEDDESVLEQLADFLRRRLGALHIARDGAAGVDIFRRFKPDIVVSDIMMPVMDGLQMARQIKAQDAGVPIILTTAFNETDYFLKAIDIGVDKYVLKPVNSTTLENVLVQCAQILLQRREIEDKTQRINDMVIELQRYHDATEGENRVVAHLMKRMIRSDSLRDPQLHCWVSPATLFSGDLAAAQRARNGDLFLMLADATGHGLAAAVNLLPLARIFYAMVDKGFSLPSILGEMNSTIREQSPADRFVAATLLRIDMHNQVVEAWNGGNPAVQFLDAAGERLYVFKSTNMPLGILDSEAFDLHTEIFRWSEAGQLFLCSDGVTEAENVRGEALGMERLLQLIGGVPREERFAMAVQALLEHLGGQPAHDDVSLMLVDCGV